jgi:selenocysteine-specific elongation factor
LAIAELRQNNPWPSLLWTRIETDLEKNNVIQRRGSKIVIANAVVRLPVEEQALMDRILKIYEETGFHSPRPDELPDLTKATMPKITKILDYLYQEKKLIKISPLVVLSYNHFKRAQDMVVSIILEKGILNSADFKYNLDTTRKYALAVLDFLDVRRVTVRSGNDRKLTAEYAKNLL